MSSRPSRTTMIKIITLLKRKPGMTLDDFVAYYESHHRLIGEKVLKPHAIRYVRRYLQPQPNRVGVLVEPDHDVLMEIWFPDQAAADAATAAIAAHGAEIAEDEKKLFDRSKLRSFTVLEYESDMSADERNASSMS